QRARTVLVCPGAGGECGRRAANPCAELCIGDGAPGRAVDKRRLVADSVRTLQDERRERDVRDVDIGQWASKDHDEPPWRSRDGRKRTPWDPDELQGAPEVPELGEEPLAERRPKVRHARGDWNE